jgi:hypothetical protein
MAYAIKGLYNYYSIYKDELIEKHIEKLADELYAIITLILKSIGVGMRII